MIAVGNVYAYTGSMDVATYVGRPTCYGNPDGRSYYEGEALGPHASAEILKRFRLYWYHPDQRDLRARARRELTDPITTLLCWCAPGACHASVIAEYLNDVVPYYAQAAA